METNSAAGTVVTVKKKGKKKHFLTISNSKKEIFVKYGKC